jgi:hypothetical protein
LGVDGAGLRKHTLRLLGVALIVLGACSTEPGPVEVLRSFMTAVGRFDLAAAENMVCEAQRAGIRASLEPFDGVARLSEAFDMSFEGLTFEERSNDGSVAIIRVTGTLTLAFLGQQEVQEVDEEHLVVREGGRWVICDP